MMSQHASGHTRISILVRAALSHAIILEDDLQYKFLKSNCS